MVVRPSAFRRSSASATRAVVGPEDLLLAAEPIGVTDLPITGDLGVLADLDDRRRHGKVAVAVDDETRIRLPDEESVEPVGEEARCALDADVPGDVPDELALRHAESAEAARDDAAGVIGSDKERRLPLRPRADDRIRFVGGEQFLRSVHPCSLCNPGKLEEDEPIGKPSVNLDRSPTSD